MSKLWLKVGGKGDLGTGTWRRVFGDVGREIGGRVGTWDRGHGDKRSGRGDVRSGK